VLDKALFMGGKMLEYTRKERYVKPKNLKELLLLALKREEASVDFYNDMSRHSFSEEIADFISGLRDEELGHKTKIQNKLKEI